jgi:cytochrome c oxidase assembly protein subunit 15
MNRLGILALATTISIYLVIAVGGYVSSIGAGLACGADWPTCKGYIIPPDILDPSVFSEYIHRILAILSVIFVIMITITAWVNYRSRRSIVLWATITAGLLVLQVIVGLVVVILELQPIASALHLAMATATFGASTVLTVVSMRADRHRSY